MTAVADDPLPPGVPAEIGPYRVLRTLGRGGMGEVLLAHDPRLDRQVAIKRLRAAADAAARRRFQREARLAAALSHPAIVPVYDFVSLGDDDYLVMERIEGPSLKRWLAGAPPFRDRLKVALQVAAGLAAAHARGIVHRDLKTENVLLAGVSASLSASAAVTAATAAASASASASRLSAKIADFGLAREASAGGEDASRLTREGVLVGTYRTMSPEQVFGEEADARSDLFSFGVLLYELFGGPSPFEADTPSETLRRLTQQPHSPLDTVAPDLPPALSRLVDRLLEKEKDLRPRSADEVLDELERLEENLRGSDSQQTLPPDRPAPDKRLAPVSAAPVASAAPTPNKHPAPVEAAPVASADKSSADKSLAPAEAPVEDLAPNKHLAPVAAPVEDPAPNKRLALLAAGAAALLLAAAFFWLPRLGQRAAGGPVYAAVLPPRFEGVATPGAEQQRLAFAVRSAALRQLSALVGVSPKNFEEIDQAGDQDPRRIAAAAGADELLRPTLLCGPADCQLRLERLRGSDGGLAAVEESELSLADLALSARSVQVAARRLYAGFAERGGGAPVAAGDYAQLLEIRHELANRPDSGRLDARLDELRELRRKSPGLAEAGWLEVEIAWRRFAETREEAFAQRAREAMTAAFAAAPDDPEVLLRAAWLATLDGRPRDAEAVLARFELVAPGDVRALDQRALLLEKEGRLDEALELRRQAAERRPSWSRDYNLAFAAFQLSRWDEARQVLDRLLAEAPEHGRALSLRARIELAGGDPAQAIERYRALLARRESLLDRANLATAHLLEGDGEAAGAEIEKVLAAAPENPLFLLTLADARSLAGRESEAAELYARVYQVLAEEEDWQSLSVRAQAQARLGHKQEAFALLQQALKKAPADDRAMAMEAALVYTLLGDRTAALYNIRKMADWGWSGWLRLAPFAVWQDDPEIGPLLRRGTAGSTPSAQGRDGEQATGAASGA